MQPAQAEIISQQLPVHACRFVVVPGHGQLCGGALVGPANHVVQGLVLLQAAATLHDHPNGSAAPQELGVVCVDVSKLALYQVADHALGGLSTRVDEVLHSFHEMRLPNRTHFIQCGAGMIVVEAQGDRRFSGLHLNLPQQGFEGV